MAKNQDEFHLVFEDGDPLRVEVVRSALEAAGVDCFIQNEGVQNLFSMGSLGGLNPLMGTVKVYIRPEDREKAEALLQDLSSIVEEESHLEDIPKDTEGPCPAAVTPQGKGFLSFFRQWFMK